MIAYHRVALAAFLAGMVALALSGCGGRSLAQAARAPTTRTTVYFLADRAAAPLGVRRSIERKSPFARQALKALLAGPTAAERQRGITTALPARAEVLSLSFRGRHNRVAVVNLTGVPPAKAPRGEQATAIMRVRAITQIARTLIGLSGVDAVEIRVDGEPWDLELMDGRVVRTETDYDRLGGWTRTCGARSAEERRLGLSRCFSAVP